MSRLLYFLATMIIPIVFSWWLFIPMALFFVYATKLPYEVILAGFFLDSLYYFGDGFFFEHLLTIFSLVLIALALFLSKMIYWRKII
ncbi:MAG: hypothetical protein UR80_C0035G0003 [Parcubacteria group bacterium GW2011_GWB1_35_5]|uniref:Uncharacterized protein n=1 Tax=Candidatus Zambryskibacteria bacterium RIFCSPLOWO2_01_FULL_35_19 TaxID=1802757 RepID=A0A1G2TY46_9BACT|nr:MAG: hypothetical protein UR50_C0008G0029 [Parcubacteria group bacterium GW2011_GWC1_34_10]KKP80266.1 MAG: hypothetical protein UR80_C0035G0003 [Parcubacteria group bacterium GW2011_GWB1_35_5]OHA86212.1 MAG: hypothetical protein A2726_01795 [Candidatus Zambryskibacteria bacterium RIFCSPHIGHO2_01_FULL_35_32]OHB02221.1 MAG: hypothetical protein A3A90_02645 [Candidatus Zambryskibacteria bacterium RIFCSPLOWO2_01_FULL_35_19]